MSARMLTHHMNGPTVAVIMTLACGLGALTVTAGFSLPAAGLVGSAAGAVGYWAVVSEP